MLSLVVLTIVFVINGAYSMECRTVEKGHHFTEELPYYGFNKNLTISTRIRFNNNTVRYLFPPTDSKGRACSQSWNQLWGTTRCGYLTDNHKDADRFVWRRAGSCLTYDSTGHVISENTTCSEANLIELAASTYDNYSKPYEHMGTLLKNFTIKPEIDTWYRLTLMLEETKTIYQLSDDNNQVLQTQTIDHRSCTAFNHGAMQGFYFGGECPAPQAVSVCYD